MAREIDVSNTEAGALQQGIQSSQKFMGDMLEDEELFHVWMDNKYNQAMGELKRRFLPARV
jgi:hypothetical protein